MSSNKKSYDHMIEKIELLQQINISNIVSLYLKETSIGVGFCEIIIAPELRYTSST